MVEVVEVREGPCGEEGVAQVLDLPLDFPLLVSAPRGAGLGREVVVAGEFEQSGVELDGGASSVEDGAAEVVVDEGSGGAAEGVEGDDVSSEEPLEGLVEGEEGGEGAGVAEDHDEAGDDASAVGDRARAASGLAAAVVACTEQSAGEGVGTRTEPADRRPHGPEHTTQPTRRTERRVE